ncbi:unnamed protein product [Cladocopium goreaui]|uniref:ZZ-type domain-containing protein n=1 Tax=Cladocopium goreaui TaxID=2562237 RepID=A0A9P1DJF3_9DINO|nr:unnamed protein product [Cladocopium goreaui]
MESSQVPLPFRIRLDVFERQQEDEHVFFFEGDKLKDLKDKEKDKEFDPAELARPFVFWKEAEPLKENRLHLNAILQAQEAYLQAQKASGELSGSGNWQRKWSIMADGDGIPPLVLAEDEYLEEVRHESLPQWWYVGSSIEFRTNKGKLFRHVAGWGSGEGEDMVSFRAAPGKCITRLQLHDGVLKGIVEEDCHVPEGTELEMFMTYWTHPEGEMSESREVKCPKGHLMRKDWSRTGHICDECSRRGTAARCGGGCDYDLCEMCYKHHLKGWASAVQRRGFASRDGAMNFASRHGAPSAGPLILGPLRLEMEDHPWLDGWRELREACTAWTQRFRSLYRQALGTDRNSGREGPFLPTTTPTRTAESPLPAGLVVDVRRGTRIRAWGPPDRLAMCEKAAVDAGEFNAGPLDRTL